jgi:hypothetical protein
VKKEIFSFKQNEKISEAPHAFDITEWLSQWDFIILNEVTTKIKVPSLFNISRDFSRPIF